ncbi:MAG: SGNH/GDSL hydrolase family protein, partial [Candidatus Aenigmatarchaeota archaeon]
MNKERAYLIYLLVIPFLTSFIAAQILMNNTGFTAHFLRREGKFDKENSGKLSPEKADRIKKVVDMHIPYKLNSDGFRDNECTKENPENVYRIAAVGDSLTQGAYVNANETWSERLERKLNRNSQKKRKFEVQNFGRSGATTPEKWKIIKDHALKYNPDRIILQYYTHDWISPKINERAEKDFEKFLQGHHDLDEETERIIKEKNLSKRAISFFFVLRELNTYLKSINKKEEWKQRTGPYLEKIVEKCKEENIPLTIIAWDSTKWDKERLQHFGKNHNITIHDLSGDIPRKHPSKYKFWDNHLNARGYRIV